MDGGKKPLTGAERSKLFRERQKQKALASGTGDHAPSVPPPASEASAAPSSATLHTTAPVNAAGPEQFAAPPILPGIDGGKEEPFAPPPPPTPPPPPVTPEEAQLFAMGVVGYWNLGVAALLAKHPELVELASELPPPMRDGMSKFDAYLYQAAVRVGVKYGLRIPYADELVCVAAVGVASYGLFGKVDAKKATTVVSRPPPNARNVTPPSSASETASKPSGPPGPLPDTSSKPWRFD